ncbi:MAG: FecR domain-containing protein [Chthoniobacterales bacterium]|nr:FecR domain-containing protein [Chthoniobacterales bacterium]
MRPSLFTPWVAAFALAAALPLSSVAQQQQMVPGNIRAVKVEGTAWQISGASGAKERLREGAFLRQGATVETAGNGNVILLFENGSTMQIRPGTRFSISEFLIDPFDPAAVDFQRIKSEPSTSLTEVMVHEGTVLAQISKLNRSSSYNVSTPLGTAGIRGTTLGVRSTKRTSIFVVTHGLIQVTKKASAFWVGGKGDTQPDQSSDTRSASDRKKDEDTVIISLDKDYEDRDSGNLEDQTRAFGDNFNANTPPNAFGDAPGHDGGDGGGGYGGGVNLPAGFGGGGGGGSGSGGGSQPAPTPKPTPTPVQPYSP